MSRVTPYYKKPTDSWKECMEKLQESTLYLVGRIAPIIFSIKDDENIYKVILGNCHSCNCGCKQIEFCIHILFCLTKVLRIPTTDALCWQRSFTDIEIDAALSKEEEFKAIRNIPNRNKRNNDNDNNINNNNIIINENELNNNNNNNNESLHEINSITGVKRHLLEGDELDICPICQDNMISQDDENITNNQLLTWCRKGCGKNIHAQCMQQLVNYELKKYTGIINSNTTIPIKVECPLCRADFDIESLKEDCRGKLTVKYQCVPIRCHRGSNGCCNNNSNYSNYSNYYDRLNNYNNNKSGKIENDFFRCIECSNASIYKGNKPYDLCYNCFNSQTTFTMMHIEHHFINSNGSIQDIRDVNWIPFTNPFSTNSKISVQNHRNRSNNNLLLETNNINNIDNTNNIELANEIESIINQREITPNDYDLLLQLDQHSTIHNNNNNSNNNNFYKPEIPDLTNHLISALPISGKNDDNNNNNNISNSLNQLYLSSPIEFNQCWCEINSNKKKHFDMDDDLNEDLINNNNVIVKNNKLKTLLCGHMAHSNCIKLIFDQVLKEEESNDTNDINNSTNITNNIKFWKLYLTSCQHQGCNKLIFPCLLRKKFNLKLLKLNNNNNNNNNNKGTSELKSIPLNKYSAFGSTLNNCNNNSNNNSATNLNINLNESIGIAGIAIQSRNNSNNDINNNNNNNNNSIEDISNQNIFTSSNSKSRINMLNHVNNNIRQKIIRTKYHRIENNDENENININFSIGGIALPPLTGSHGYSNNKKHLNNENININENEHNIILPKLPLKPFPIKNNINEITSNNSHNNQLITINNQKIIKNKIRISKSATSKNKNNNNNNNSEISIDKLAGSLFINGNDNVSLVEDARLSPRDHSYNNSNNLLNNNNNNNNNNKIGIHYSYKGKPLETSNPIDLQISVNSIDVNNNTKINHTIREPNNHITNGKRFRTNLANAFKKSSISNNSLSVTATSVNN